MWLWQAGVTEVCCRLCYRVAKIPNSSVLLPDFRLETHPFYSNRKVLVLLASLCCLIWGSSYPAIKIGYAAFAIEPADVAGKLLFAGWRSALAGFLLLLVASLSGKHVWRLDGRDWLHVAGLGVLQTSVMCLFFYIGMAHTTGVKSSVLNGTVSFFGVLLAHFIHHNDRLSWAKALGCIVGFTGVLAVNFGHGLLDFNFTLTGEGFIVFAAFFMAAGMVYGKSISQRVDSILMTGYQLTIGGSALLFVAYGMGGGLNELNSRSVLVMGYLVLNSAVAYSLWSLLLKHNRAALVAVFNFLVPIFGALLSAAFLGETILEWKNVLAIVLVCSGIWLVTREKKPYGISTEPTAPSSLSASSIRNT